MVVVDYPIVQPPNPMILSVLHLEGLLLEFLLTSSPFARCGLIHSNDQTMGHVLPGSMRRWYGRSIAIRRGRVSIVWS